MPKKKEKPSPSRVQGKVAACNISPKGEVEGVLIDWSGTRVQLNFPKHSAAALARSMPVGAAVDVQAELEAEEGEHPVYTAIEQGAETSGKVVRLNYALHGEVNGYHLDDGTFLHVKPHGAKKYKVRIGERVTAAGAARPGADAIVVEVRELHKLGAGVKRASERAL